MFLCVGFWLLCRGALGASGACRLLLLLMHALTSPPSAFLCGPVVQDQPGQACGLRDFTTCLSAFGSLLALWAVLVAGHGVTFERGVATAETGTGNIHEGQCNTSLRGASADGRGERAVARNGHVRGELPRAQPCSPARRPAVTVTGLQQPGAAPATAHAAASDSCTPARYTAPHRPRHAASKYAAGAPRVLTTKPPPLRCCTYRRVRQRCFLRVLCIAAHGWGLAGDCQQYYSHSV